MRLTARVVFGLLDAVNRAEAELQAICEDSPQYAEEHHRVKDAREWVEDEIMRRARSLGITYDAWVQRERAAAEQRSTKKQYQVEQ